MEPPPDIERTCPYVYIAKYVIRTGPSAWPWLTNIQGVIGNDIAQLSLNLAISLSLMLAIVTGRQLMQARTENAENAHNKSQPGVCVCVCVSTV